MITLESTDRSGDALSDLAPDLTPMLDILFILLVFFILTAGAVFQSLELTLPESVSDELRITDQPKHIMLEIRPQGYALDGSPIKTPTKLKEVVSAAVRAKPDYELIVAADKNTSIERLLSVLTFLQSRGIEAANILMKKDPIK